MTQRPTIGITVHLASVAAAHGEQEVRFETSARYAQAVRQAGGVPLLVPTDSLLTVEDTLDDLDGLLLSGGGSLPSAYFEQHPNPTLRQTNPVRYDVEVALVKSAWVQRMPLLGVCRGHQTIAEALGGAVIPDVRGPDRPEHYQSLAPTTCTHGLTIEPGSLLGRLLGPEAQVNSFHRQAVDRLPDGWRVVARSPDGLVEAMEVPGEAGEETSAEAGEETGAGTVDRFGVGCQFHPEWLYEAHPGFERLFEEFVAAAGEFRRQADSG